MKRLGLCWIGLETKLSKAFKSTKATSIKSFVEKISGKFSIKNVISYRQEPKKVIISFLDLIPEKRKLSFFSTENENPNRPKGRGIY